MEWNEARALKKSSSLSEISMLSTQQVCFDDVRGMANFTCDDFSVDDLLDFSDKDFEDGSLQESEEDEAKDSFSSASSEQRSFNSGTSFGNNNEFEPLPEGELAVPVDDMENLEWLSQFVDDSETEISLLYPVGSSREETRSFLENRPEEISRPAVQRIREPCFPLPVSRKPRGKRSRLNSRVVWSVESPSLTSESSSSTNSAFVFADPVQESDLFFSVEKLPAKKQKKKPAGETSPGTGGSQTLRRCTHCQVHKTPQWRTGPLGPKTLCNACGVRYKSGRLFPEYRPACSPTFSQGIHSNSHRRVLEMRQKKEITGLPEAGSTSMVPSF